MNNKFKIGDIVIVNMHGSIYHIGSEKYSVGIIIKILPNNYYKVHFIDRPSHSILENQLILFTKDSISLKIEKLNDIEKQDFNEEYSANIYIKEDDNWFYRFHLGDMTEQQLIDKAYNKIIKDLKGIYE
ncbi:MAG: hypothetical protein ACFFG0_05295 [Candidatus Thorarchaeota archaeon]